MNKSKQTNSVLMIGGNLICGNIFKRKLLKNMEIAGVLLGNSPLSLACTEPIQMECRQELDEAVQVDVRNGLETYLQTHPADYLVLDLHYVHKALLRMGNTYFTAFEESPVLEQQDACTRVTYDKIPSNITRKLLEDYGDILLKYFPGERIILVKTYRSEFYAVGNRIRTQKFLDFNRLMDQCEQWFSEHTHCRSIDTLKFYYMVDQPTGIQYETEAYRDLSDNILRYIKGMHVRKRPIFQFSLDRYCRYFENIYTRAFSTFLRKNNAVELLVYSSRPWFIKENYELLRSAEKLLLSSCQDVAENLDMQMPNAPVMRQIFLAMDACLKQDYVNPSVNYGVLFENQISLRELYKSVVQYARKHWDDVLPQQITVDNYGYYFVRMQKELAGSTAVCSEASKIMAKMEENSGLCLRPYAIDMLGSCVSRLNFQFEEAKHRQNMVICTNLFQALPIFWDLPAVDPDIVGEIPEEGFENKILKIQLEKRIPDVLNHSGADWIVIDLYALTSLKVYRFQDTIYCDSNEKWSKQRHAPKVKLYKDCTKKEMLKELDRLARYLKSRYGRNIILIKHKCMEYYVDAQNKIRFFSPESRRESAERNLYNAQYADYLAKKTGCYYIDFVDQFLADEMNLLYLNSLHYEDAFYEEVQKLIYHIIREHPIKKHFTTYSSTGRVKRLIRMRRADPENKIAPQLFGDSWLDRVLLTMDADAIEAHQAAFVQLYDFHYTSARKALRSCKLQECRLALEEIQKVLSRQ